MVADLSETLMPHVRWGKWKLRIYYIWKLVLKRVNNIKHLKNAKVPHLLSKSGYPFIRKSSSRKDKEGVQKYKYFVCSKQGFRRASTKMKSNRKVKLHASSGRRPEKAHLVSKGIHNILKELKESNGGTSESKISELESFIGSSAPEQIDILPPKKCNTKGSGKRLKGGKEQAMEQQQKRLRLYRGYGQAYHDSCNCPSKLS
ncbi:hypothetical protein Cgig2_021013 [Carnegiea gigantea]|uniref:Uncharacterized protein n=1 Tax=Carnegiea gigantea TaxID=171969 RepID=A0A9Q1JXL2_9CARY|nr:hypothetical protein Cgig2_021013 [Carnegiea gigantea]